LVPAEGRAAFICGSISSPSLGILCGSKSRKPPREPLCPRGGRDVPIFRGGMLICMQHFGIVKRLFMEVRPPVLAPPETGINNEFPQSYEGNGTSMVSLQDSLKFRVSRKRGRGGRRRQNAQNEPNFAPAAWLTEQIVQNEPKLGGLGVSRQAPVSCGPRLGRGVKRAKRTQFRSVKFPV
jgi:hypothetical protein